MNRGALRTTSELALIAVVVVLFWLFGFGDPCLGTEISNKFTAHDPPAISAQTGGAPGGTVVIDNPYGIETCDHWPTPANHITSASVLGVLLFAIGWFAARHFPHRPLRAAAGVAVFALGFALAVQVLVRLDAHQNYFTRAGSDLKSREVLLVLVLFTIGAGVAMFGAWLSRVIGRRA